MILAFELEPPPREIATDYRLRMIDEGQPRPVELHAFDFVHVGSLFPLCCILHDTSTAFCRFGVEDMQRGKKGSRHERNQMHLTVRGLSIDWSCVDGLS